MTEIIKDVQKLAMGAEPLQFLTSQGVEREEGEAIVMAIKAAMAADETILALSAPQLGFNFRIFCIRFNDVIKTFINPIVTKKANYSIKPETFISMPGKEILITRPEEVTVVYYTDEFKYEENKLLGAAARLFDQQCQLLDGIVPADLGLVSDVEADGSLAELSEEEIAQVTDIYKQYIQLKTEAMQKEIKENSELEKQYNSLRFTEKVINGQANVVAGTGAEVEKQQKRMKKAVARSMQSAVQAEKQQRRNSLNSFLKKRGK